MEIDIEIKKRILSTLSDAYSKYTMSGLSKWVKSYKGKERAYARGVMSYLEEVNSNPSKRAWGGVDSFLLEQILQELD